MPQFTPEREKEILANPALANQQERVDFPVFLSLKASAQFAAGKLSEGSKLSALVAKVSATFQNLNVDAAREVRIAFTNEILAQVSKIVAYFEGKPDEDGDTRPGGAIPYPYEVTFYVFGPEGAVTSARPLDIASERIVRTRQSHKRSGTLSLNGNEVGKFKTATDAAKSLSLELHKMGPDKKDEKTGEVTPGKPYPLNPINVLSNAGYTWTPDPD